MASKDRTRGTRLDSADFCVLQVELTQTSSASSPVPQMHFVTVDNRMETLSFVENNLDLCARNILKFTRGKGGK